MTQKVSVVLLCDLHDEQDVEAAETAVFGIDGATYEIELCEDHGQQLRFAAAPFVSAGRSTGTSSRSTRSPRPGQKSSAAPTLSAPARSSSTGSGAQAAVREWARAHGYTVSDRGRLSAEVTAAYQAAQ